MQKFINYQLADIENAINNQPPRPCFEVDEEFEAVKGAIEYLNMEPK